MGLLQNLVELSNGPSCFFREKKVSAVLPDNVYQCYLAAYDEEDLTSFCCGTSDVITFESAPDGHQLKKD